MTLFALALGAELGVMLTLAVAAGLHVHTRHRLLVAEEKAKGHRRLIRRVCNAAGRQHNVLTKVARAETMYGWVWMVAHRRPRQGFGFEWGWSLTERVARRRADEATAKLTPRR